MRLNSQVRKAIQAPVCGTIRCLIWYPLTMDTVGMIEAALCK